MQQLLIKSVTNVLYCYLHDTNDVSLSKMIFQNGEQFFVKF